MMFSKKTIAAVAVVSAVAVQNVKADGCINTCPACGDGENYGPAFQCYANDEEHPLWESTSDFNARQEDAVALGDETSDWMDCQKTCTAPVDHAYELSPKREIKMVVKQYRNAMLQLKFIRDTWLYVPTKKHDRDGAKTVYRTGEHGHNTTTVTLANGKTKVIELPSTKMYAADDVTSEVMKANIIDTINKLEMTHGSVYTAERLVDYNRNPPMCPAQIESWFPGSPTTSPEENERLKNWAREEYEIYNLGRHAHFQRECIDKIFFPQWGEEDFYNPRVSENEQINRVEQLIDYTLNVENKYQTKNMTVNDWRDFNEETMDDTGRYSGSLQNSVMNQNADAFGNQITRNQAVRCSQLYTLFTRDLDFHLRGTHEEASGGEHPAGGWSPYAPRSSGILDLNNAVNAWDNQIPHSIMPIQPQEVELKSALRAIDVIRGNVGCKTCNEGLWAQLTKNNAWQAVQHQMQQCGQYSEQEIQEVVLSLGELIDENCLLEQCGTEVATLNLAVKPIRQLFGEELHCENERFIQCFGPTAPKDQFGVDLQFAVIISNIYTATTVAPTNAVISQWIHEFEQMTANGWTYTTNLPDASSGIPLSDIPVTKLYGLAPANIWRRDLPNFDYPQPKQNSVLGNYQSMSVMAFNICNMPEYLTAASNCQSCVDGRISMFGWLRAAYIGRWMKAHTSADVVVMPETWAKSQDLVHEMRRIGYHYVRLPIMAPGCCGMQCVQGEPKDCAYNDRFMNSSVATFSKWPTVWVEDYTFRNTSEYEQTASKGITYVKLRISVHDSHKEGRGHMYYYAHVFASHPLAMWTGPANEGCCNKDESYVYLSQMEEFKQFMDNMLAQHRYDNDEPVIIAGDMNRDAKLLWKAEREQLPSPNDNNGLRWGVIGDTETKEIIDDLFEPGVLMNTLEVNEIAEFKAEAKETGFGNGWFVNAGTTYGDYNGFTWRQNTTRPYNQYLDMIMTYTQPQNFVFKFWFTNRPMFPGPKYFEQPDCDEDAILERNPCGKNTYPPKGSEAECNMIEGGEPCKENWEQYLPYSFNYKNWGSYDELSDHGATTFITVFNPPIYDEITAECKCDDDDECDDSDSEYDEHNIFHDPDDFKNFNEIQQSLRATPGDNRCACLICLCCGGDYAKEEKYNPETTKFNNLGEATGEARYPSVDKNRDGECATNGYCCDEYDERAPHGDYNEEVELNRNSFETANIAHPANYDEDGCCYSDNDSCYNNKSGPCLYCCGGPDSCVCDDEESCWCCQKCGGTDDYDNGMCCNSCCDCRLDNYYGQRLEYAGVKPRCCEDGCCTHGACNCAIVAIAVGGFFGVTQTVFWAFFGCPCCVEYATTGTCCGQECYKQDNACCGPNGVCCIDGTSDRCWGSESCAACCGGPMLVCCHDDRCCSCTCCPGPYSKDCCATCGNDCRWADNLMRPGTECIKDIGCGCILCDSHCACQETCSNKCPWFCGDIFCNCRCCDTCYDPRCLCCDSYCACTQCNTCCEASRAGCSQCDHNCCGASKADLDYLNHNAPPKGWKQGDSSKYPEGAQYDPDNDPATGSKYDPKPLRGGASGNFINSEAVSGYFDKLLGGFDDTPSSGGSF